MGMKVYIIYKLKPPIKPKFNKNVSDYSNINFASIQNLFNCESKKNLVTKMHYLFRESRWLQYIT